MKTMPPTDVNQAALWNGHAGHAWVASQTALDQMFQPLEDQLVEAVSTQRAQHVLDVGCGTGSTTLAIARQLGANGSCLGIDISAPMLQTARERAQREPTPARFVCADAQTYAFQPAAFDMIVSRLGVMFFDDPVAAFTNLRGAARDGAALCFIAWRGPADNPFMTAAERAAAPLLPNLPPRKPGAPGQFAFADRSRVTCTLAASGWTDIDIQPVDVACTLPERELVPYLSRLGPVGLELQEADSQTRTRVIDAMRTAFEPYVHGTEVRFTAACWIARARATRVEAAHD
ncbi:methyltransferase domain-containing protein [Ralstonia insidiosa]|uniref:SAM-dependent methyltransferase n=1 Tax=Ralstonia insidiosa TaxID=190721 RepID=A0A192A6G9_9RALS|nr:class I SAM-dependent methyltransferase [Ralstonia insidiosa]ANJ75887.1 SAM-dependent methyltransferase [Ralstonia insidiosa]KAB0469309.1 methyltransferase domain-containing protein [Ralstonia insidiosa]MBY4909985.1 methyltransferase domain-containing protein [Ralstonia insidiosa]